MNGPSRFQTELNEAITENRARRRFETGQTDRLLLQARQNLWELLLFLLFSMAALAWQQTNLHQQFSEEFRQLLGMPLPATLLSLALGVYLFTAVIQVLVRQSHDTSLAMRSFHLVFRSVFYLFYSFSGVLAEHFAFVFASGLALYGLEQASLWLRLSRPAEDQPELVREP